MRRSICVSDEPVGNGADRFVTIKAPRKGNLRPQGSRSEQRSNEELSKTLATLRPYASMLVIANDDAYVEEMLAALRA